jgi:hypothetical protein
VKVKPVHVDEVLARPGYHLRNTVCTPNVAVMVGGHRSPALPATGIADPKTADRRVIEAVEMHLHQPAHSGAGARSDPCSELSERC